MRRANCELQEGGKLSEDIFDSVDEFCNRLQKRFTVADVGMAERDIKTESQALVHRSFQGFKQNAAYLKGKRFVFWNERVAGVCKRPELRNHSCPMRKRIHGRDHTSEL